MLAGIARVAEASVPDDFVEPAATSGSPGVRRWNNELSLASTTRAIACFVGAVTVATASGSGGWLEVGALVLFGACLLFLVGALWGFGVVHRMARRR